MAKDAFSMTQHVMIDIMTPLQQSAVPSAYIADFT